VTAENLLHESARSGVTRIVAFPFPSTAIIHEEINDYLLKESENRKQLIPYYYIQEHLRPIPQDKGFYGGKWHWVGGVQDCSSNYQVLENPQMGTFIEQSAHIGLLLVFEEKLTVTLAFVGTKDSLKMIIPHLGMSDGDPFDFLTAFRHNKNVYFDTSLAGEYYHGVCEEDRTGKTHLRIIYSIWHHELGKKFSLPFGEDERVMILPDNIRGLIGLE
jgi:uncharacterized protein